MNLAKFGVSGTLGNGEELTNILRRKESTHSYHVIADGEEKAIRYDYDFVKTIEYGGNAYVLCKPIFKQHVEIQTEGN